MTPDAPTVTSPNPRDLGSEMSAGIGAYTQALPGIMSAQRDARAADVRLDTSLLKETLLGDRAGQYGNSGMLDVYSQEVMPRLGRMQADAQMQQGRADMQLLDELAPRAVAARRNANPNMYRLLDLMQQQATDEMGQGSDLTPEQARLAQQDARAAFGARGLSFSNPGIAGEILGQSGARDARLAQRRGFADNVMRLGLMAEPDPSAMLLGRGNQAFQMGAGNLLGATDYVTRARQMPGVEPFLNYSGDLFNTNYNADAAGRIATANNKSAANASEMALYGSMISGLGSLGGSALTGFAPSMMGGRQPGIGQYQY